MIVLCAAFCAERDSWLPLRVLAKNWRFNDIQMGASFEALAHLPFQLRKTERLDATRVVRHYTLENDTLRLGALRAERIVYTFNHNDMLKDVAVDFTGKEQYAALRTALLALFGEPQHMQGRRIEEWYNNSVMFALDYDAAQNPPGRLRVSLLTPCAPY